MARSQMSAAHAPAPDARTFGLGCGGDNPPTPEQDGTQPDVRACKERLTGPSASIRLAKPDVRACKDWFALQDTRRFARLSAYLTPLPAPAKCPRLATAFDHRV